MLVIHGNLQGESVSAVLPAAAAGEARFVNNTTRWQPRAREATSASGRARAPAGGRTVRPRVAPPTAALVADPPLVQVQGASADGAS